MGAGEYEYLKIFCISRSISGKIVAKLIIKIRVKGKGILRDYNTPIRGVNY
jgi:hypothetical protein